MKPCRCARCNMTRVGTVLGAPTALECQDLIRAKEYQIGRDANARGTMPNAPDASWDADFAAVVARWAAARTAVQTAINAIPESLRAATPMAPGWATLLTSIRKNWTEDGPGSEDPSDLSAVERRLITGGGAPTYPDMPQPTGGSDYDLRAFIAADKATKAIEKGVKFTTGTALPVVVGLLVLVALAKR